MDFMDYSHSLLKKYDIKTINDITLCNACLRPSGASYRDRLMNHEWNHNPSKEIDDLLKENRGFLIYQEDTIKFLTEICGLSGGDADNIRRAIGHKDYDRLNEALPSILNGYCNNSSKDRGVAEEEAKQFLKIIEDSASYQFGFNHSTGYSLLGYMCGYLRHYHALEFITSYLSNAEKQEDIINGEKLARFKGISINNPIFRKSKGEYFFDKDTNSIYKGIGSIKFMNSQVGEELYELRNNTYNDFVDLLFDINSMTSCNSKQLDILIKLDFFKEFGGQTKLLKCVEVFNAWINKKTIPKQSINNKLSNNMHLYASNISEKTGKETATWRIFDKLGLIKMLCNEIKDVDIDVKDIIKWQVDILGYVSYTDESIDKRVCVVQSIDGKTTRRVRLYCLNNGKSTEVKIQSKVFSNKQLSVGDIIYLGKFDKKAKSVPLEKDDNGKVLKWGKDDSVMEWWLTDYSMIN